MSSPNQTSGCLTQPHPPGKQFGWPRLAAWSLGAGICATVGANLAHGVGRGPVGALVSAWPALALVGSFGLLLMLFRTGAAVILNLAFPRGSQRHRSRA